MPPAGSVPRPCPPEGSWRFHLSKNLNIFFNRIIKIKFSHCLELGWARPGCSSRGTCVQLDFLD